jgi:hypothetical protein
MVAVADPNPTASFSTAATVSKSSLSVLRHDVADIEFEEA